MGREMIRRIRNRFILLFLVGLFLCLTACSLPGSGKKEARKAIDWETEGFTANAIKVMGEDIAQFPYHEYDYYDLGGKFKGKASVLVGDTRFVLQRDRSTSGVCHRLLIQTKEERQWKELPVEEDGMFFAVDGWQKEELYGLFNKNSENSQEYVMYRLSTSGEILEKKDVTEGYLEAGVTNGALKTAGCWYADNAGYSYVIDGGGSLLHVFDESGKHVLTGDDGEKGTMTYTGAFHAPDGRLLVLRTDRDTRHTELMHVKDGRLKSAGKLDIMDGKCFVFDSGDYIYYLSGSMLVKWDIQNGEREILYSLYQGTRHMNEVAGMALGEDGSFLLYVTEESGLEVIRLWDREAEAKGELVLTKLVEYEADPGYLSSSAATYSREHRESAVIRCRSVEGNENDFRNRVFAEMAGGEGPDMLWVTGEDMEMLEEKGLLADLRDYLSEETLGQIFPGVIEAGTVNDRLVGIFPTGYIEMMVTSKEVWSKEHWSMEEIFSLAEEPGWDGIMSSPLRALNTVGLWDMEQSGLLITEGDKQVLDTQLFTELLEKAKETDPSGENYILDYYYLWNFSWFSSKMMAELPADYHFVGFPGQSEWVGCWLDTNYLVVNKNAAHKEVIADFLESLLSYDYLMNAEMHCVREDVIRERIIGGEWPRYKLGSNRGVAIEVKEDGSTYVEEYVAFLKTCGPEPRGQSAIEDMVREEAREYLEDRRSLEETVRIIQNRVQLYLDEQR